MQKYKDTIRRAGKLRDHMPGGLDHFSELLVRSSVQIYDSREGWELQYAEESLDSLLQGVKYRVRSEVWITCMSNKIIKWKDSPPI